MTEPVRLVIWDLDETYWKGTLTEGGITYQRSTHDIVIELARRGIMSSICSKNDHDAICDILTAEGIWDYFIFPSINWGAKGLRLRGLIEDVQLRPASVMFIDDNPMNRNEAVHFVPELQVEDETFPNSLLLDPRFKGKDDSALTRLAQYKLLEKRQNDRTQVGNNIEFLRQSAIEVTIEYDIEPNIDRAIELINRTNQLNFTKRRQPEDTKLARAQLLKDLHERNVQAGLVRVRDNYGDYGIIGFYLLHVHTWHLVHFCFSCRTLGMGIERWVYEQLKAPSISVVGEVLTDLHAPAQSIDWINNLITSKGKTSKRLGRVLVRGGCEMQGLAHYIGFDAKELVTEFAFDRDGFPIPINHSVFIRAAFDGVTNAQLSAAQSLGYRQSDFESKIADQKPAFDTYIFSFWVDGNCALYGHRETSIKLPFIIPGINNGKDIRKAEINEFPPYFSEHMMEDKLKILRQNFDFLEWSLKVENALGETLFEQNLRILFDKILPQHQIYILLGCERVFDEAGKSQPVFNFKELNRAIRKASDGRANIHLLAPDDFVTDPSDIIDATHFDRRVYFRIYQQIVSNLNIIPLDQMELSKAALFEKWNFPSERIERHLSKPGYELPNIKDFCWYSIDDRARNNWIVAPPDMIDWAHNRRFEFRHDARDNIVVLGKAATVIGSFLFLGSNNLAIILGADFGVNPINVCCFSNHHVFFWGAGCTSNTVTFELGSDHTTIVVGEDCMFSAGIGVHTHDEHGILDLATGETINVAGNVHFDPHVWVGQNATVLKGVRAGFGSIIGTGAVVTSDVPMKSIVAGVPAKVVRENIGWVRERIPNPGAMRHLGELEKKWGKPVF